MLARSVSSALVCQLNVALIPMFDEMHDAFLCSRHTIRHILFSNLQSTPPDRGHTELPRDDKAIWTMAAVETVVLDNYCRSNWCKKCARERRDFGKAWLEYGKHRVSFSIYSISFYARCTGIFFHCKPSPIYHYGFAQIGYHDFVSSSQISRPQHRRCIFLDAPFL